MSCLRHLGFLSLALLFSAEAVGLSLRKPEKRHKQEEALDPWSNKCRQKLKAAGQWGKHNNWKFAPPLPRGEESELRTIWMLDKPHCATTAPGTGHCIPTPERDFTFDWLLRDLPVRRNRMLKAGGCRLLAPNAAFMYNNVASCTDSQLKKLAAALKTCDASSVLFHFGDAAFSSLNGSSRDFGYEDWTLVVRTYFNSLYDSYGKDHVITAPLGYSSNFFEETGEIAWQKVLPPTGSFDRVPKISARNHTWAFFGDMDKRKNSRQRMMTALKLVGRGMSTSAEAKLDDVKRPVVMHQAMQNAMFCPAPAGFTSPDTNRFAEALESGCFPLVDGTMMQNYWRNFFEHEQLLDFGQYVKLVDDWDSVPDYIEQQLKRGGRKLNHEQQDMLKWWTEYKRQLAKRIATLVRQKVLK